MLLERSDVDPDTVDRFGQTPLLVAAYRGREGVVRILLERNDVNPDTATAAGHTPLLQAARRGHERVVRMLLERSDVDPDTVDTYRKTPLFFAAKYGHEGVVTREDTAGTERHQSQQNSRGWPNPTLLGCAEWV